MDEKETFKPYISADRTLHEMAERAFCDEYILSNSDMIVAAGELDTRAGNIIRAANDRGIPVIRI